MPGNATEKRKLIDGLKLYLPHKYVGVMVIGGRRHLVYKRPKKKVPEEILLPPSDA
jgi:hypothetical protein